MSKDFTIEATTVRSPDDIIALEEYPIVGAGDGKSAHRDGAKAKKVQNAELFAAIKASKIERWSRESLHLYFAIFIAFCCACANGYDGSLMTSLIAMEHFQNTFQSGTTGPKVSVIFSLYTVGSIVGAPFAAILADRYGRRLGMLVGGVIIIVGMIIAATSSHIAQFIVGRFILGLGIAAMTVAAPAYAVEINKNLAELTELALHLIGVVDAQVFTTLGGLEAFACVIVMASVAFIPESPRFLIANGREQEAIEFLVKYHGNGDPSSPLVRLEVEEMREHIRQDGIDKRSWDYRPFIFSHSGRWRMAQVLMIAVFGQFSGNGLGYFNTVIFANIGISTVSEQLGYNLLNAAISAVAAFSAVLLTDRMRRRPVLIYGTLACAVTLALNSGLSAALDQQGDNIQESYAKGALAAYFLFNVVFSFTYTPLQAVIPTEALETTTRAKGLGAYSLIVGAMGFINQFAGPIGLGNLGYKYIFIFVGWDIIETIMWYLFGVESQGRTLEQLEWVYNQPNPVKASRKVDQVIVQADGTVTEKVVNEPASLGRA